MGKSKYCFEDAVKAFKERGYNLLSGEDEYKNCSSKLRYICPKHKNKGENQITLSHLLRGGGCPYCARERTIASAYRPLDKEEAKSVTENLGLIYVDSYRNEKSFHVVKYICPKHKEQGIQEATIYHLKEGRGCHYCGIEKSGISRRATIDKGEDKKITESKGFVYIDSETDAPKARHLISFICPKHRQYGIQTMRFDNMSRPEIKGCQFCNPRAYGNQKKEYYQVCPPEKLEGLHPNLKVIDRKYKRSTDIIHCYCTKHNVDIYQTVMEILTREVCPYCATENRYVNENKMCELIRSWGLKIKRQKTFSDCVDKKVLPFDCYLVDYNVIIEYDGAQHFYPVKFNGCSDEEANEAFQITQKHDKIKNDYCNKNKIPIIRIGYKQTNQMQDILRTEFKKLNIPING